MTVGLVEPRFICRPYSVWTNDQQ